MTGMLRIDGSYGEGGGQIIRSSLALSLVSGRPFVIENIRSRRSKPGLMRQHLTAVRAAAEIGRAECAGAAIGARQLTFIPSRITPGDYRFSVGTAGSTTLVLQTVLPALMIACGRTTLTLEGGTHNPFAPPFDFLDRTYLPLVNRMGPTIVARLETPGFYPAGGGRFRVSITPAESLRRLDLVDPVEITSRRVRALVAKLPKHIGQRECDTIAKQTGWDRCCLTVEEVTNSRGPGNVVMIELLSASLTEVITGFGQIGVKAERVATKALQKARHYIKAGLPVGEYLADQIMLPMAIGAWQGTGGGTFRTRGLSLHAKTHLEIIKRFLDVEALVEQNGPDDWQVTMSPAADVPDSSHSRQRGSG